MSEKRVLVYSEGDFDLESEVDAKEINDVFKELRKLKGDPFSEVYKGKKVKQTVKVISENFYTFMVNTISANESILGISKRTLKEEDCDIIIFDNVEFEEILSQYDRNLKDLQEECVRNLNSLTEEREFIKKSFNVKLGVPTEVVTNIVSEKAFD